MKKKKLTPITDFLYDYSKSGIARFHMPGHKGNYLHRCRNSKPFSYYDITEIKGADSLYEANGVIMQSEKIASRLYNSYATVFSAGGSTLCIQAMLLAALKKGDSIICGRNAHIAFHNSIALFGIKPYWIYPKPIDQFGISGEITPKQVKEAILKTQNTENPPKAVYITSPDYMGVLSDVAGIARVCGEFGLQLLVDNAHGAHMKFTPVDRHPITLGATMCCDSAHKTLPVLTGGAYLHSSKIYNERMLKDAMALVGSTSPSYLILNSLDRCNQYISNCARNDFSTLCECHASLMEAAMKAKFSPVQTIDCTKLSLNTYSAGITAEEAQEFFLQHKIQCEYAKGGHIIFMISPFNTRDEFARLFEAFEDFSPREPKTVEPFRYPESESAVSPNDALFSESEIIPIEDAEGRISAQAQTTCPPGVPIVTFGEVITKQAIEIIKNNGKQYIKVIK